MIKMPVLRRKKISPFDPLQVEVTPPDETGFSYDLLDEQNLERIGINRADIEEVRPVFAVPGYLYEEEGVAGKHHRLLGSVCAELTTYDNRRCSIDDLWYFDENVKKNHFGGKPHWNHERRFVDHSTEECKILYRIRHVEPHIIPASPYIDISLDPGPEGKKAKKRVFSP